MRSTLVDVSGKMIRRAAIAAALTFIGLLVGAGCVLFPSALPGAIVGLSGLLLLWAMPDLQRVPERLAAATVIPFVVSILAVPAYYGLILPGLPWISVRRVAYTVFAFAVVITISGSAAKRSELWRRLWAAPVISASLMFYLATVGLSVLTSTRPAAALTTAINEMLFELLPFLGIVLIVRTDTQIRRILVFFLICVCVDLVIGSIEYRLRHPFLIYALPQSMRDQITSSPGLVGLVQVGTLRNGSIRAFSVYTTALSWGEMSAMMAPIGAFFATFSQRPWARALGGFATLACATCIFLSGSRGAWVGFIASLLLFFGLYTLWLIREKPQTMIPTLALGIGIVIAVTSVSSVFFVGRVHKAVLGGAETASSTDARNVQWALARPKILARPFLGYGAGLAADTVGWTSGEITSLDSYVISLLVGVGIPGCIAFFTMLIAGIYSSSLQFLRSRLRISVFGAALGCCITPYAIYRTTLSQGENNTLVFMLIGLVVCLAAAAKEAKAIEGSKHSPSANARMAQLRS